ncbi:hypothetical protein WICMUC_003358 [Wickerhamomyces mucosus]|uniref:alpha-1,2-Mannosidase n=1 Tax=Wickerhamomyces mucosus TaxID=1378264 RepID=A0A9P8TCR9_9ASCO|nr:hypothetical protein WICMUC_003358 [Wickerhamomyces mucosus]
MLIISLYGIFFLLISLCLASFPELKIPNGNNFIEIDKQQIRESSFTKSHLESLRNQTRELFNHGWNSYMDHAFPADEILPITCEKYERVPDINDINRNDVLGNYSVTFLDTITTFAIMNDIESFENSIKIVKNEFKQNFNIDSTVQVFETTIRALGSLLSAHLFAEDKFKFKWYDGFLLNMALDLGERLLLAFDTPSGIPIPRINLQNDLETNLKIRNLPPQDLIQETCSAGAGSPILEFTLLSILTNDSRFEKASRKAFFQIWSKRSKLDLIPMTLDPHKNQWLDSVTGIGASIDSFYEYALKGSILFQDDELFKVWQKSYISLKTHSKLDWFFTNVHFESGSLMTTWIDSLGAFFPGLLVLGGELKDAIKSHQPFIKLWNKYGGIPERWDFIDYRDISLCSKEIEPVTLEWYPLRPEFIESTYYLYRATKDPLYLRIGEQILKDYQQVFKVDCGFTGYHDIRIDKFQNRMESFVLSETLMYLYLLFDESNSLNHEQNFIFSTEGHPLWIPKDKLSKYRLQTSNNDMNKSLTTHTMDKRYGITDFNLDHKRFGSNLLNNLNGSMIQYIKKIFDKFHFNDEDENNKILEYQKMIHRIILLNHGIELYSIDEEFKYCERYDITDNLFHSKLLESKDFYELDSKYWEQRSTSKTFLETSLEFYWNFVNPNSQCLKESNNSMVEFIIGNINKVKDMNIEYMKRKKSQIQNYDIWIHNINGLKLKFEVLKPGEIDSNNQLITLDFVEYYLNQIDYQLQGQCNSSDESLSNSILRLKVINGIELIDSIAYIAPENIDTDLFKNGILNISEDGFLVIDNFIIINIKLWEF